MTQENPFKVGEVVPSCIEIVFYYSEAFSDIDFLEYIQRERVVPNEAEATRLFELYKKYLQNESTNNTTPSGSAIPD